MKPNDLQKMCSHCDGRIPMDAVECPYCATELVAETKAAAAAPSPFSHQSLNDSLASLYSPPYSAKGASAFTEEKKDFSMKKNESISTASPYSMGTPSVAEEETSEEKNQSAFWPILLLSLAGNLVLLGLLQFFFSDGGKLRLEWDSGYWFFYVLAAIPLFFFGMKKANLLK